MLLPDAKADCHCHSTCSDGSLSPTELIDLAKTRGLTGLSITDHDTLEAYPLALPYAQTQGIDLIAGIEISAEHRRHSVHILGYAFDLQHPALRDFCVQLQTARITRNQEILARLAKHRVFITLEELKESSPEGTVGRPHIAALMLKKGYVKSLKQAFDHYLGEKQRAYVSGYQADILATIALIHQAGGFAVLAHPHYLSSKRLTSEILEYPFDGIEAFTGRSTLSQSQPWITLAEQKGWFITGGSDFHGAKTPYAPLGCAWTPPDIFEKFKHTFEKNNSGINC